MQPSENHMNGKSRLNLFESAVKELDVIDSVSPVLEYTPYAYFLDTIDPADEQMIEEADGMLRVLIQNNATMSLMAFVNATMIQFRGNANPISISRMWQRIIESGADVNETRVINDSDGETVHCDLIHDVISRIRDPLCKYMVLALIQAGVDPKKPSVYGFSLAAVAIGNNNDQTLEVLLNKGCSISAREANSRVSSCKNGAVIEVLRAVGIEIKPEYMADAIISNLHHVKFLSQRNKNNELQEQLAYAEEQLMKFIAEPSDINWRGENSDEWPLQVAIDINRADIVQRFLDAGAIVLDKFHSDNPQIENLLNNWKSRNDWKDVLLRVGGSYYLQYDLGSRYMFGDELPRNPARGISFLTQAADQGYADAQYSIAMSIMNGDGVPADPVRGAYYLRLAAKQYHVDALYYYGRILMDGDVIPADLVQGFEYLTEAALRGHNDAIFQVGFCYQTGNGVAQNYRQAARWFTRSARMQDADGMTSLGMLYANGWGVPVNRQLATDLFAAAAALGNANARDNLTICYQNGFRPNPGGYIIPDLDHCARCSGTLTENARFCTQCGTPTQ